MAKAATSSFKQRLARAVNAFPRAITYPTGQALKPRHASRTAAGWLPLNTCKGE